MRVVETLVPAWHLTRTGWNATPIVLRYTADEPHEVALAFEGGNTWRISRDLLRDGLSGPAGLGDVQMFRYDDVVFLRLYPATAMEAMFVMTRVPIGVFLATADQVVAPGEESHEPSDDELRALLGGAS